jgi:hypothetical protein
MSPPFASGLRYGSHSRLYIVRNRIVKCFSYTKIGNSLEMQRAGWAAMLENFRKYCELG